MEKLFIFLFVFITLGCKKEKEVENTFSTTKIVNLTQKGIVISIQYDRLAIDREHGKNSYRLGTLSIQNYPQISFDSEKLISKVKLNPKDSLLIDYEKAKSPTFKDLKKIEIQSSKTLILNNRQVMKNSFLKKDKQLFILEIK